MKFGRNGLLDLMIRFVINGGYTRQVSIRTCSLKILESPVASSMMITLLFLTRARARETRERYVKLTTDAGER